MLNEVTRGTKERLSMPVTVIKKARSFDLAFFIIAKKFYYKPVAAVVNSIVVEVHNIGFENSRYL
jgi:hypothetical protein